MELLKTNLFRAICGRIEKTLQGLPPPFLLNRPQMLLTTSSETRHPAKAPSFSVNWSISQEAAEIINTTVGKPESGLSRLCKQNLMKRFLGLCNTFSKMSGVKLNIPGTYSDAKMSINNYNVSFFYDFVNMLNIQDIYL